MKGESISRIHMCKYSHILIHNSLQKNKHLSSEDIDRTLLWKEWEVSLPLDHLIYEFLKLSEPSQSCLTKKLNNYNA